MRITLFIISFCLFLSCKKNNDVQEEINGDTGSLTIEVNHFADSQLLMYNTWHLNGNQDSFTVSFLKYYLSNIEIKSASNQFWKEAESYHLVQHSNGVTSTLSLNNVPIGEYDFLTFSIGVDSARNVSGAQTGALDPGNNMFWSWNSGYIFFKLEGQSPSSPVSVYTFHVGGFQAPYSAYRTISMDVSSDKIHIRKGKNSVIQLKADVMRFMNYPNQLNLQFNYNISTPGHATQVAADNYKEMFSVIDVINN